MTSMPASRSARAMTLAPRSWPSNPGLAISTRIFFSGIVALLPLLCALCVLCVERLLVAIVGHDESANAIFQDRHIEIDQQSKLVPGESQISQYYCFVDRAKTIDRFELNDDPAFDKQVQAKSTFQLCSFVNKRDGLLLFETNTAK